MAKINDLILTQGDFQKLSSLIKATGLEGTELLEEELSRAQVVADENLPRDVVSMNSRVTFQDLENGKETMVTIVYPHETNIEENKISILAPVGSALIGLRVGQVIQWPIPNGKEKKIKVVAVLSHHNEA